MTELSAVITLSEDICGNATLTLTARLSLRLQTGSIQAAREHLNNATALSFRWQDLGGIKQSDDKYGTTHPTFVNDVQAA